MVRIPLLLLSLSDGRGYYILDFPVTPGSCIFSRDGLQFHCLWLCSSTHTVPSNPRNTKGTPNPLMDFDIVSLAQRIEIVTDFTISRIFAWATNTASGVRLVAEVSVIFTLVRLARFLLPSAN